MANNTNGKPVAEIRVGRITTTIRQNTPTDEGVFYSVHITRRLHLAGSGAGVKVLTCTNFGTVA